jgi:hypothetical protein
VTCDFLHFTKPKRVLKGRRFNDVTMIQAKSQDAHAKFQITDFRISFKQWCDHWAHCIKFQVDYFESDNIG